MSKEDEILKKCISCHDKRCAKIQGSRGGSCISGVSVLQKVTLNPADTKGFGITSDTKAAGGRVWGYGIL